MSNKPHELQIVKVEKFDDMPADEDCFQYETDYAVVMVAGEGSAVFLKDTDWYKGADDDLLLHRLMIDMVCTHLGLDDHARWLVQRAYKQLEAHLLASEELNFDMKYFLTTLFNVSGTIFKSSNKRRKPLIARNNEKQKVVERAREIASEAWKADKLQIKRIGEMVDLVLQKLHLEGYSEVLPENQPLQIRKWISQIAPEYARRGGRPKTR